MAKTDCSVLYLSFYSDFNLKPAFGGLFSFGRMNGHVERVRLGEEAEGAVGHIMSDPIALQTVLERDLIPYTPRRSVLRFLLRAGNERT